MGLEEIKEQTSKKKEKHEKVGSKVHNTWPFPKKEKYFFSLSFFRLLYAFKHCKWQIIISIPELS